MQKNKANVLLTSLESIKFSYRI